MSPLFQGRDTCPYKDNLNPTDPSSRQARVSGKNEGILIFRREELRRRHERLPEAREVPLLVQQRLPEIGGSHEPERPVVPVFLVERLQGSAGRLQLLTAKKEITESHRQLSRKERCPAASARDTSRRPGSRASRTSSPHRSTGRCPQAPGGTSHRTSARRCAVPTVARAPVRPL